MNINYHPFPVGTVKKMMGCNVASLKAGGGALYLKFDTRSTQNIFESLKRSAGLLLTWRGANTLQPL